MSPERVIRADQILDSQIEEFAYATVTFTASLRSMGDQGDDRSVTSELSTPEDDIKRLASLDQVIYEKMQKVEKEAQEILRKAYEEGFAAGEAEGRSFGESQYQAHLQSLDGSFRELKQTASLLGKAAEDEVIALSLAMAEYLAGQQIEFSHQAIQPLLASILETHPFSAPDPSHHGNGMLTITLNPKDLEQLGDRYVGHRGIRLLEDPALSRGSLRIEASEGVLEATLERRRDRILELLKRNREKDRP